MEGFTAEWFPQGNQHHAPRRVAQCRFGASVGALGRARGFVAPARGGNIDSLPHVQVCRRCSCARSRVWWRGVCRGGIARSITRSTLHRRRAACSSGWVSEGCAGALCSSGLVGAGPRKDEGCSCAISPDGSSSGKRGATRCRRCGGASQRRRWRSCGRRWRKR